MSVNYTAYNGVLIEGIYNNNRFEILFSDISLRKALY